MENNLVRTEDLLGSRKNVIGNVNADIILETLGKVYIKTGKQTRVLNDVFKLLDGINSSNAGSKTVITKNLTSLKYPGDGYLVFDSKENALYISYDKRYLLIIDGIDKKVQDLGFVKKQGDTMYGPLQINHHGAPLIVASNELVKRFNANYLQGHDSNYFAAKSLNELIEGSWSFQSDTSFEKNITVQDNAIIKNNINVGKNSIVGGNSTVQQNLLVNGGSEVQGIAQFRDNVTIDGDIILDGSIGSPMFMSGYQGYGWRFDANTNMLTVDYLVVRKAMHVFELVVNKISATNGSLWVTDSAKVDKVYDVKTLPISSERFDFIEQDVWYIPYEPDYNRQKITINDVNIKRPEQYTVVDNAIEFNNNYYDIFKYICKYKPFENGMDKNPINIDNIDKIAVLFAESDINLDGLTHFARQQGFGFPLDGEVPIYIYNNKQSFREPIKYDYCDANGQSLTSDYNEEYAYIKLMMYVKATEQELSSGNDLYKYNSITKKYIKYTSDIPEYERNKYKYIKKTCYVKVLYSKQSYFETATHFKHITSDGKEYFLEAKPTHIQNTKQRYTWNSDKQNYVEYTLGEFYFNGTEYTEFKEYIKTSPPTHYYDSNTKEYKESTYYDENSETYIYSGTRPEYFFNEETGNWEKGASHVYNDATDEYVQVKDPTYVLSNYQLTEGLSEATHVFVPEPYFAEASNVYVPTHKKYENSGNIEFITQEEINVKNPQISVNKVLDPILTPKIIVVDKQLKYVTPNDIKYLNSFYKYFGITANDDIWDGESIITLDNVKVIKMKEDEYPPFKEGDILRCQKFEDGNIKFYEAVVACKIDTYSYVIITAGSVFDIQTTIEYNDDGTVKEYKEELNKSQYSKTSQQKNNYGESVIDKDGFDENSLIAGPAPEDGLVRIGHLYDRDRQNSVYITSSEMNSPYIQTISGVNRPDYTVLYGEPAFITNDRGFYQFSTKQFEMSEDYEGIISVNTPIGIDKFECKNGKFFAPNNHYIKQDKTVVLADYNPDKVVVNTNSRVRLGNLNGITDPMFGNKQPYGYGLFADNVFLKGEFYLNNGSTVVEFTKEAAKIESKEIAFSTYKDSENLFVGTNSKTENINTVWNLSNLSSDEQGFIILQGNSTIYQKSKDTISSNKNNNISITIDIKEAVNIKANLAIKNDEEFLMVSELNISEPTNALNFTITKAFIDQYIYLVFEGTQENSKLVFKEEYFDKNQAVKAAIKMLGDSISLEVQGDTASSGIEIDEDSIVSKVEDKVGGAISAIEQKADKIAASVGNCYTLFEMPLFSKLDDSIKESTETYISIKASDYEVFKYKSYETRSLGNDQLEIRWYNGEEYPKLLFDDKSFLYFEAPKNFNVKDILKIQLHEFPSTNGDSQNRPIVVQVEDSSDTTVFGGGIQPGQTELTLTCQQNVIEGSTLKLKISTSLVSQWYTQVTISYPLKTEYDIITGSLLQMTEENITLKLQNTGIDITNGLIEFTADNTKFDPDGFVTFGGDNGAVYYDKFLFSQQGHNGLHYSDFTPDTSKDNSMFKEVNSDLELSGAFIPKIHLDFLNGLGNFSCLCEPFYTLDVYKHYEVLDPKNGFNIKIPFNIREGGDTETLNPCIILPQFEPDNAKWLQNGTHITITYEHGGAYLGNLMNLGGEESRRFFVLVCSNIPEAGNTNNSESGLLYNSFQWDSNYIICRSRRSKFLLLAPGSTIKLRATVFKGTTESGDKEDITRIHWLVENEGSVREEKVDVYNIYYGGTSMYQGNLVLNTTMSITPSMSDNLKCVRRQFYGADYSDAINLKTDYHGATTRGTFLYAGPQGYCPKNIVFGFNPTNDTNSSCYRMLYASEIGSGFSGGPILS